MKAYSATEEHNISLNQVHTVDGGRVRVRRVCEIDGAEVPADEVGKGYLLADGDVVLLTSDDLASLPLPTMRAINVCAFAPQTDIDPIAYSKSYYLEPEDAGLKPYVLLSEALQQSGLVAVVKVTLRQRETLALLRVRDQVIVLQTMLWPDEVRAPDFPFLHTDVDVSVTELRTTVSLIEQLSGRFDPAQYSDEYRQALEALIRAKVEGEQPVRPTAEEQDAGVSALLDALKASVEPAESRQAAVRKAKSAARKAAAAKDTATKSAAKARGTARTRH